MLIKKKKYIQYAKKYIKYIKMTEVGMYYQQKDYKGTSHPLFIEYFLSRNISQDCRGSIKIKPSLKVRCFLKFWIKGEKK